MSTYNANNPLLHSATLNDAMEEYLEDSFRIVTGNALYEQMFYKQDVYKNDPESGKKWAYTFEVTMPQGPGGFAELTEEMLKGAQTPGVFGNMLPDSQKHTIGTKFQFASIGRSKYDDMMDDKAFFEAIQRAQFGESIKQQQDEEIKKAIFNNSTKLYVGGAVDENALTATDTLTWAELEKVVAALEIEEVQVVDNMYRVSEAFYQAVSDVAPQYDSAPGGTEAIPAGSGISSNYNVIDFNALAAAQASFEDGSHMRTYEWFTPRFTVSINADVENYRVKDFDGGITLSMPSYETLYNSANTEGDSNPMTVFTTREGMRQLWADPEFQAVLQTGAVIEPGGSGKFSKYTTAKKVIEVMGVRIIDMGVNGLYGTLASEGTRRELAMNTNSIYLDATLIASPGYNFITTAPEFGKQMSTKGFGQTDSMDRLGLFEFLYVLWTWDVQILNPGAFTTLIHAGRQSAA